LAAIAAISLNLKKPTYWTVMDRESLANSESCSSARRCANGADYDSGRRNFDA